MYTNYKTKENCIKTFEESAFLSDVKNANFNCDNEDPNLNYENLVNVFRVIINKRTPLKQKTVRGNESPFMNKNAHESYLHKIQIEKPM